MNTTRSFIEPALATLRTKVPSGPEWIHEIKLDGYRAQAHLNNGSATIFTRRGHDWTASFQSVADDLRSTRARSAVLDGEIVVLDAQGRSDFRLLQQDLAQGRTDRLTYFAFDLLEHDGTDFREKPLSERKNRLHKLLRGSAASRIRLSEHLETESAALLEHACAIRVEGIVSKRKDSTYRSGRTESWIKVKCNKSDNFPIIAFVEKLGAKPRRIASVYLGQYKDGKLIYAGKAQTGFTNAQLYDLRERLDPFIRSTTPLDVPIKKPKATWVEPRVEAEVEFSGFTSDGLLRAPVFKGVRDDLSTNVSKPRKAKGASKHYRRLAVPKENILQLLPEAIVPTKDQLTTYWKNVSKRALPYLGNRPLKLVRSVKGTTFYHRGPLPPIPPNIHTLKIEKREGGEGIRVWIDDLSGLLGLLEMDVVEVHPWNATIDDIERADTMVFDLDPGEGIAWEFVRDSSLALKHLLTGEGFTSWPKLTGGKGVHLVVPLDEPMKHNETHRLSRHLATQLLKLAPKHYTLSSNIAERRGRLFIDYLRNGRGTTAIGTYSPRAREGFPIAAPITWKQIEGGAMPNEFTINRLPRSRVR